MVNKTQIQKGCLRALLLTTLLTVASSVLPQAADGSNASVDQFKQWLQEQDQKNEAALKQYKAPEAAEGSASGESDVAKAAFSELLGKTMPMTPAQIHDFKKAVDTTQRAVATPANAPPKPMSSTLLVSLAPGEQPPAI